MGEMSQRNNTGFEELDLPNPGFLAHLDSNRERAYAEFFDAAYATSGSKKVALRKLPVPATGRYRVLVGGIGLGLSGPVLTEVTRSSFGSVKEVSRTLGVPVLGAVDLILDDEARRATFARGGQPPVVIGAWVLDAETGEVDPSLDLSC